MIICDASPLIALGKEGKLFLLKELFEKAALPKRVHEEVLKKEGSHEVVALENATKEGWIKVEKVKSGELETKNLGKGEKEAIALAVKHGAMLIIDDDHAKTYASIMGVEAHGTLYVLLRAKNKGLLEKYEVIEILDSMMNKGFYISTDTYKDFLAFVED